MIRVRAQGGRELGFLHANPNRLSLTLDILSTLAFKPEMRQPAPSNMGGSDVQIGNLTTEEATFQASFERSLVKSRYLRERQYRGSGLDYPTGTELELHQFGQCDGPLTGPTIAELHTAGVSSRASGVFYQRSIACLPSGLSTRVRVPHRSQLRRSPGDFLFRPQPVAVTVSGRKRPAQVTLPGQTFLPAPPAVPVSRFAYWQDQRRLPLRALASASR
jgi:hypothetical protein